MKTLTVELTHDKALDLLRDLEALDVIRLIDHPNTSAAGVRLGSLAGQYSIPDDFNAPLDDLKDYQ